MRYIRNRLERSHSAFNSNKMDLPKVFIKLKMRGLMNRESLLFHPMLKQGITWFTLATETQETV